MTRKVQMGCLLPVEVVMELGRGKSIYTSNSLPLMYMLRPIVIIGLYRYWHAHIDTRMPVSILDQ